MDKFCYRCNAIVDESHTHDGHSYARSQHPYVWRKCSKWWLANHPLCSDCQDVGRTTPSVEVHHKEKPKGDLYKLLDPNNLLALCKRCHSIRTARGE